MVEWFIVFIVTLAIPTETAEELGIPEEIEVISIMERCTSRTTCRSRLQQLDDNFPDHRQYGEFDIHQFQTEEVKI